MLRRAIKRLQSRRAAGEAGGASDSGDDAVNKTPEQTTLARKLARQNRLRDGIYRNVWLLRALFNFIGITWLLLLPLDRLSRTAYIDEHAVQPGQVTTYWSWADVHAADRYLNGLELLWEKGASSEERSAWIAEEFRKLGLTSGTQNFTWAFPTSAQTSFSGINTHATISPPRASGSETLLLTAPWHSLLSTYDEPHPNLRGIATLLSLARFLRGQNHWAKEFVILIADGGEEGVASWLAGYHGTTIDGLKASKLSSSATSSGSIWNALNIDYPGHSFSHLGLFYEGVNGALPNQDLLNAITHIARWTAQVPVQLHRESSNLVMVNCPGWMPAFGCDLLAKREVMEWARGYRHLRTHFGYAALGKPKGAHGVFAKYKIDGLTLFAEPATGPHGFHALGILLESTLRSCNNLLERLHASFFFYLIPQSGWFTKIGNYLPAAVLLAAGITIGGLAHWIDAGWWQVPIANSGDDGSLEWRRRNRKLQVAALATTAALLAGQARLWASLNRFGSLLLAPARPYPNPLSICIVLQLVRYVRGRCPTPQQTRAAVLTLSAILHLITGAGISCMAMINFPKAVLALGILLPTLALAGPGQQGQRSFLNKSLRGVAVLALAPENVGLLGRIFLGGEGGLHTWWVELLQAMPRDRTLLGRTFLDEWMGLLWPLQLLAAACIFIEE